jgi:hypothetical protein
MAMEDSIPLAIAERRIFGFDHAEVGTELMRAWELTGLAVDVMKP